MNELLLVAGQNTIVALVLAVLVYGLSRAVRNPPLAHALWLVVLFKLVSPPLVRVDWRMMRPAASLRSGPPLAELAPTPLQSLARSETLPARQQQAYDRSNDDKATVAEPAAATAISSGATEAAPPMPAVAIGYQQFWASAAQAAFWCWCCGAALFALSAAVRIVRFKRALQTMLPATALLERLARETAGKLGVRRVPAVRVSERVEVPLLWCLLRPTIVLPARLTRELDDRQIALVLAHELAHLRRRDHWVRLLELVAAIVYWWNPLVWFIRRQIHEAEDLCCDAWVRSACPEGRKTYAEVVLKAAESLTASHVGRKLLPASLFLRSLSLKERIEMILESRFHPCISRTSMLLIAVVAVLVLPTFVRFTKGEATAQDEKPPAAAKPDAADSQFPYTVKFEQGATKFLEGDKIAILEIRGTAETFKPGEIYWIKGTYTLASHDRATLATYTTAKNAADGRSRSYSAQTTTINNGSGTFTLFLPMACEGWPHVSFYPADGGEGFGGNYFGTGESVLKRWWGSKDAGAPANEDKAAKKPDGVQSMLLRELQQAKENQASRKPWRAFGRVTDGDGQPLAGVEIVAHRGDATLLRAGLATSGDDGRYQLELAGGGQMVIVSARKAGYFEENLNRQGKCAAAEAMPDETQMKWWAVAGIAEDRFFLPGRPLEIDFVMRRPATIAGRLVNGAGEPLAGNSISLVGPDLPPGSNVASETRTDENGRFALDGVPTGFRYQLVVCGKTNPKHSWASAALTFERPEKDELRARFGDRHVHVQALTLCVSGPTMDRRTAARIVGGRGALDLSVDDPNDVVEQSEKRLVAKSAVLTLSNAAHPDLSRSLIKESVPAAPAVAFATRLARSRANEAGELTISFENPPGFDLARGTHQVIFQVFVGASQRPVREKIFRQLDIEEGRYEVPIKVAPELIDDSRVSITFVTIQPEHDAWVKAFFHEGKKTTYRGIWTSDGDILPAIPIAAALGRRSSG